MSNIIAFGVTQEGRSLIIENGLGNSIASSDPTELLHFLVYSCPSASPSDPRVFSDLDYSVSCLLRLLPDSVGLELRSSKRAVWDKYKLFYISGKLLGVRRVHEAETTIFDLGQYFPQEDLRSLPIRALQEKASQLQQALSELGIDNPPSLSSPVACFKGHELLNEIRGTIPTIFDDLGDIMNAHEIALSCTPREWIGNYQIGHFPRLWKYDIASAYAYRAALLPNLNDCTICKAEGSDLLSDYGFLIGDFTVYPDHPLAFCSPFLVDRGDGVLVNFTGTERNYTCTLHDIRCLYAHRMGEFHFKHGWLLSEPDDHPTRPFANVMNKLYAMRGSSPVKSHILKRVMNGIIGRLLETRRDGAGNVLEYGENFNPIYHALITNSARLQVFAFLAKHKVRKEELVHVGVDGVRVMRKISVPDRVAMGGWRCAGCESAFVLSPGAIVTSDRNFKRTGYADLLAECGRRPTAYRLGSDRSDPIDLRRLFLTQTRGFTEMPKQARDLATKTYLSEPVHLGA